MRDNLIRDLFAFLGQKYAFQAGHTSPENEQRLEALPLPLEVKRLLQWRWPTSSAAVGPYTLNSSADTLENSDLQHLLAARMVPVGSADNGDLLVISFPTDEQAEVGLVSHDTFWEEGASPQEAYVRVAATVEEYLLRVAEGRFLPIDSFSAAELAALRDELGRGGV